MTVARPNLPWWAIGPLRARGLRQWARETVRSGKGRSAKEMADDHPDVADALRFAYQELLDAQAASYERQRQSRERA